MPLHKKLFYLLLLLLPTQLSLHLWPSWSYVLGRRIDYLSPTIYITDILIFLIIIFYSKKAFFEPSINLKIKLDGSNKKIISSLVIISLIFLNISNSKIPPLTFYKWLKILEFFLLGFYIYKNINLKKDWENIIKILSIGIIFESILAIAQFINQSSLNGLFYWFGERNFTLSTPNLAKAALNGILILRPYTTFPHPNALAGYLAVILPLILITDFKPMKIYPPYSGLQPDRAKKLTCTERSRSIRWVYTQTNRSFLGIKWLAFVLGLVALFLTFSRPAIILGILGIVTCWAFENYKNKYKNLSPLVIILLIFIPVIFYLTRFSLEKESIDRRLNLNIAAVEMFKKNPIFGIGLGNFIPQLPLYSKDKEVIRFLQPAHNIYLLTLAETGFSGLAVFLLIIFISIKNLLTRKNLIKILILNSLFLILILGLIDHYFYSLQQTQLLFTIIVSLSLIKYPHEV